jgi:RNA polymerase sigma factor (sigma-70 family)
MVLRLTPRMMPSFRFGIRRSASIRPVARPVLGSPASSAIAPGYEPPEQEDESPDALAQLVTNAEGSALRTCLEELEPDRRKLLMDAYADGLSHSELAEKTGAPLGTIKSWIRRSLASLKRCLES